MFSAESQQPIERRFLSLLLSRQDALESKQRFLGLLKDFFPQEPAIVNVMALLHGMGIHTEIENAGRVTKDFVYRFVKRLVDEYGTNRQRAGNAVRLFCLCWGEEILGMPCDLGKAGGGGATVAANGQPASNNQAPPDAAPLGPTEGQNLLSYSPPSPQATPVNDIAGKYCENHVAADMQYQGKRLLLTGTVEGVKKDWEGNTYVELQPVKQIQVLGNEAYMDSSQQMAVAQLRKGQTIEFIGTVYKFSGLRLKIKNCELL